MQYSLLILIGLLICFNSCKNDAIPSKENVANNQVLAAEIIGSWTFCKSLENGFEVSGNGCATCEFENSGKGVYSNALDKFYEFRWTLQNDSIKIQSEHKEQIFRGKAGFTIEFTEADDFFQLKLIPFNYKKTCFILMKSKF